MNRIIPSPAVRSWVYGILVAAAPLAVAYGLISQEQVALWLGVISAALGNGLALLNVDHSVPAAPAAPDVKVGA